MAFAKLLGLNCNYIACISNRQGLPYTERKGGGGGCREVGLGSIMTQTKPTAVN